MERPPVSIVIPVWNAWTFTKLCLETLRPTLSVRDEIIIVDNGSTDATAKELRLQPRINVITNAENLGFAKACNQGAAAANNQIIVFLNNDTAVPRSWLDELVAVFEDSQVGAAGPRTNHSSGAQIIDPVPYRETRSMGDFREFARDWMREHRGETTEVERLVGFCVAVRKSALEQVGGWDERYGIGGFEDDDLSISLIKAGWKLLICHGSFIHHHGSRTFKENNLNQFEIQEANSAKYLDKHDNAKLVSACIITKDEEENIRGCIESLKDFVDEVVVYDTGSLDQTCQIARSAGAKVVMGFWNDNFSRARNAALEECSAQWILHIDADERLEIDEPIKVRGHLLRLGSEPAILVVPITNVDDAWAGGDIEHNAARVFSREDHHWEGRLHEKVVRRDGMITSNRSSVPGIQLKHFGYTKDAISNRKKIERNVRLARADLSDPGDTSYKKYNLGRSLMMARENEEAITLFTQSLEDFELDAVESGSTLRRDILRAGIEAMLTQSQFDDALNWIERLSNDEPEDPSVVHYLRAQALFGSGEYSNAAKEFESVDVGGPEGSSFSENTLLYRKGLCYQACERWDDALVSFLGAIEKGYQGQIWPTVIETAENSSNREQLLAYIDQHDGVMLLMQISTVNYSAADILAEMYWQSHRNQEPTLEFVSQFASKLSHARAVEWSERFRELGRPDRCPLIAIGVDNMRNPIQRIQAIALAHQMFADERGEIGLRMAASKVDDKELVPMLAQLIQMAPALIKPFLESAATTSKRALRLAAAMEEAGAPGAAIELRQHASTMPSFSETLGEFVSSGE